MTEKGETAMIIDKDGNLYEPTTTRSTFRPEQGSMIQIPIERREEAIPEGYVKVVRCKECKHFKFIYNYLGRCECLNIAMLSNDFCSRGERKEETE